MQLKQLSCLALGVCFLWGPLRFITSKGDFIEIYRGPEVPSHSSLYNCVNVYVWVELYGDEPAGRDMQLVLCHLKQTEPFREHRSNASGEWVVMWSHFMQHSLTGSVVGPAHTTQAETQTFLFQLVTAGVCPPVSGASSWRLQRRGSGQTLQVYHNYT